MEKEIPAKRFAGALLIILPIVIWMTVYIRFDCAGGSCSLPFTWLIVGFAAIIFGLVVLLSPSEAEIEQEEEELRQEQKKQEEK